MKRKGIIFYYVVAIVFPCILLGILAFRGIKNDQALVEREQRRILQETTQQIFQDLNENLQKIENSFIELAAQDTIRSQQIFSDSILNFFCEKNKLVKGIFHLENSTDFYIHNNGLLFFPDGYFPETENLLTFDNLKKGWQYEFSTKEFYKAFQFYSSVYKNSNENQAKGELLNAMARLQKKMENFESALEIYDSLQKNYSRILIQNKIPLGVAALIEKSNCCLLLNDTISALENSVLLLKLLSAKHWQLEESYYFDYLRKADELVLQCRNLKDNKIENLVKQADLVKDSLLFQQQQTTYLLTFFKNRESIKETILQNDKINKHRFIYRINGKTYFYSVLLKGNKIRRGLIFNTSTLIENVLIPTLNEQALLLNYYWEITNEAGNRMAGSENIPSEIFKITTPFTSELPDWSLTIYSHNTGLLTTFFKSGGGLFFYIFIVVLLVLVFGLIFTLQTVNHNIQLTKMKSTFVSTVSHELKSPLTSIRQIAEILVRKRVPTEERKEKYFAMILQQSERLSHLVENILDFSKMEAGQKKFRFEKVDLPNLAERVIWSFQDQIMIADFKINLIISDQIINIKGDYEALEQVIHNLIDNAIKYSDKSNCIEIKIELIEGKVVFSVKDFGVGIPKKEQDKIFNQFYRVGEELTQTVKGTGIGLTIVKQIVEAHKGEIIVVSAPGKGSTFSIKFPQYKN